MAGWWLLWIVLRARTDDRNFEFDIIFLKGDDLSALNLCPQLYLFLFLCLCLSTLTTNYRHCPSKRKSHIFHRANCLIWIEWFFVGKRRKRSRRCCHYFLGRQMKSMWWCCFRLHSKASHSSSIFRSFVTNVHIKFSASTSTSAHLIPLKLKNLFTQTVNRALKDWVGKMFLFVCLLFTTSSTSHAQCRPMTSEPSKLKNWIIMTSKDAC